jgi:Protein of unknown function (DUF3159)
VQTPLARVGGLSGLVYSSLPIVVFIPASTALGLLAAVAAALSTAALILAWRLWRAESYQPAVAGFIGVGLGAAVSLATGGKH